MTAELHPKITLKALAKTCWWPIIVIGMFPFIVINKTPERFIIPSVEWMRWVVSYDFWLILVWAVIALLLAIFVFITLTSYLRLENGVLERHWGFRGHINTPREVMVQDFKKGASEGRWNYLRDTQPTNRVVLQEMETCEIESTSLTVGRGLRDYRGFTFTPKNAAPIWQVFRIDMPVGLDDNAEQDFLHLLRKEMSK